MAVVKLNGQENIGLKGGQGGGASIPYIVTDATGELDAYNAILSTAPATLGGYFLQSISITDYITDTCFGGSAEYGTDETTTDPEVAEYSFDTTGNSQHITQSIVTAGSFGIGGSTPPSYGGAIGATRDSVQGCDIVVPGFKWTEAYKFAIEDVDQTYRNLLADLTGRVNNASFRGRAAGEVLFLGARGQVHDADLMKVEYSFAASPNQTGISIGAITGITKGGFQYLWVRYYEKQDDDASQLVKEPLAAYVETVYPNADLALLGI